MSSRTVVIDGVTYVRSRDAGRIIGLAADYISRLARAGLVAGRQVYGLWFVDLDSVNQFLSEQERQKQIWRARQAQLRREEQRRAGHPSATS